MTTVIVGTSIASVFHPVTMSKHLMQMGYEPFPPYASKTIFGSPVLLYPSVWKYMKHIKQVDGFFGLYRGIGPRIVSSVTGNLASAAVTKKLKQQFLPKLGLEPAPLDDELEPPVKISVRETSLEIFCEVAGRTVGIIVSQPFHVLMIRSIAQFIGRETTYSNSFTALAEIFHRDGILGFFSGLMPRLLGEILSFSLTYAISHVICHFIVPAQHPKTAKDTINYTRSIVAVITGQLTYPLQVVTTVSIVSGSGLVAGEPPFMPIYSGWSDILTQLSKQKQLKRGASLFWRRYYPALSPVNAISLKRTQRS